MPEGLDITTPDDFKAFIAANHRDPLTLSICMIKECPAMVRCAESLYAFNGKCYDIVMDADLMRMFHDFVIKYGIVTAWKSRHHVIDSINAMSDIQTIEAFNDYTDLMCINNGILNIHTKEIAEHDPKYYFDSYININYDKDDVNCPEFLKYLESTFNGDQETIENVVRLGGYLLDPTVKAGKMFLLDGPGGSGKSTLLDTFSLFFTGDQISPLSLEELASGGFDKELLIKSRFNVTAEAKKTYIDAEEIKKIVTGDIIKVARKYKISIRFRPKTKIVIACNGLPRFTDTSEGIFRRLILIKFSNQYRSKIEIEKNKYAKSLRLQEFDNNLLEKITKEKNAIFNLFLSGLSRLRDDNYQFILSDTLAKSIDAFRRDSDSVREFLEDNYEIDESGHEFMPDIYNHYRQWHKQNVQDGGTMKFRANEMGRRIKEVFGIDAAGRDMLIDTVDNTRKLVNYYGLRLTTTEQSEAGVQF